MLAECTLAWLGLSLLHQVTLAVRTTSTELGDGVFFDQGVPQRGSLTEADIETAIKTLKRDAKAGVMVEQEKVCADVSAQMLVALRHAHALLQELCDLEVGTCAAVEKDKADDLIAAQFALNSAAALADHKFCLGPAMAAQQVQAQLKEVLAYLDVVLASNGHVARAGRLRRAFRHLRAWQEGTLQLSDQASDRSILHKSLRGKCPKACDSCEWTGSFSFRCHQLAGSDGKAPEEQLLLQLPSGPVPFSCSAAHRAGSALFWRTPKFTRECEVANWKEVLLQQVHLSAMVHCGLGSILAGVMMELADEQRQSLHEMCMRREQDGVAGNSWADQEMTLWRADTTLSAFDQLAFGLLASTALAQGLAALRLSALSNRRPAELASTRRVSSGRQNVRRQAAVALTPSDLLAVFAKGEPLTEEELKLYTKRHGVNREATLQRIEECDSVYQGKNVRLYLQASRSLTGYALSVQQQATYGSTAALPIVGNLLDFPFVLAFLAGVVPLAAPPRTLVQAVGLLLQVATSPRERVSEFFAFLGRLASGRRKASTEAAPRAGWLATLQSWPSRGKQPTESERAEVCWAQELPARSQAIVR